MKLCLLLIAACFLSSSLRADDNLVFFTKLVDSIPKAAEKEFPTPESVARAFVEGVLNNRIDETFKCVPLKDEFLARTFENQVHYTGDLWDPSMGFPDDAYQRFMAVLVGQHYKAVSKIQMTLVGMTNESSASLFDGVQSPPKKTPDAVQAWMTDLSAKLSLSKLRALKISSADVKELKVTSKYIGVLPFTNLCEVTVHVPVNGSDFPIQIAVGLLNGNYQIYGFPGLPAS